MSEENDPKKKPEEAAKKKLDKTLTEEERKQLIEKIKASLYLEDEESVQLYASLIKASIP